MAAPLLFGLDPPKPPRKPIRVLLLGTFHFEDAGQDAFKPAPLDMLSPQRQREIGEVVDCLAKFAPTRIGVEMRRSKQAELTKRYDAYRAGEFRLTPDELDQLGLRLAKRLDHERIDAIDAPARWFEPFIDPTEYAVAHDQAESLMASEKQWDDFYEAYYRYEDQQKGAHSLRQHLLSVNEEGALRTSAGHYLVGTFKSGVGDDYPGADAKTGWYNRNLRIFANITRMGAGPDDRILIIIGAGHVPILRHLVESSPEYELAEVGETLGPGCASARNASSP
jgi:hypothetical protein